MYGVEFLIELFNMIGGVYNFLFVGVEWVVEWIDFNMKSFFYGGFGCEGVVVGVGYLDFVVFGMDIGFYFVFFCYVIGGCGWFGKCVIIFE